MVSFESYLLRFVSLDTLLKSGSKFWDISPVTSAYPQAKSDWYSLSAEATCGYVDYFVSHTWRSNGFMKHLALAYFINGPAALKVGHAVAALVFTTCLILKLAFQFEIPHVVVYSPCSHSCDWLSPSFFCTFCGGSAQLLVLFFGHYLPTIVKGARKSCFVDKFCVCQTNEKLKQEAIYSFDGILRRTNNMLILWDRDYFERLWCAFEVASFSKHHGINNFNFMPIVLGVFTVAMTVVNTGGIWVILYLIHALGDTFMKRLEDPYMFFVFWTLLGNLVWWWPKFYICSKLAEGRQLIIEQLRTFDVQKTRCFDENDRDFVQSHIVEWFGSLDNFNDVVQKGLMDVVEHSLGSKWQATPYRTILLYSGNVLWVLGPDALLVARGWSERLTIVIFSCGCYFVMNPLFFYCANALAQLSMTLPSGITRRIGGYIGVTILGFWWPLWYICCANSSHWVSGSLLAVGAVFVAAAYRQPVPARCGRPQQKQST